MQSEAECFPSLGGHTRGSQLKTQAPHVQRLFFVLTIFDRLDVDALPILRLIVLGRFIQRGQGKISQE